MDGVASKREDEQQARWDLLVQIEDAQSDAWLQRMRTLGPACDEHIEAMPARLDDGESVEPEQPSVLAEPSMLAVSHKLQSLDIDNTIDMTTGILPAMRGLKVQPADDPPVASPLEQVCPAVLSSTADELDGADIINQPPHRRTDIINQPPHHRTDIINQPPRHRTCHSASLTAGVEGSSNGSVTAGVEVSSNGSLTAGVEVSSNGSVT